VTTAPAADDNVPIGERLQGAVARVLPAIEATIARLAAGPHHPRAMEQAGRTLSSLTRTLRELNALLAEHKAETGDDEPPRDIDEFRQELARRLQGIIATRKQRIEEAKTAET
jgi:multidrug resistance efflux pump